MYPQGWMQYEKEKDNSLLIIGNQTYCFGRIIWKKQLCLIKLFEILMNSTINLNNLHEHINITWRIIPQKTIITDIRIAFFNSNGVKI